MVPTVNRAAIVNLRTARKRVKRQKAEQQAAANRLTHGQSKAERKFDQAQSDEAARRLDQHLIITGDRQ